MSKIFLEIKKRTSVYNKNLKTPVVGRRSTHKTLLCFYTPAIWTVNIKGKLRKQFQNNEITRNKFHQRSKILIQKLMKHCWKTLRKTQVSRKTSHVHG